MVQKIALEKITDAIVVGQYGDKLSLVLFEKGEKDWSRSVNAQLVKTGLAKVLKVEEEDDLPKEVNEWYKFEEDAKEGELKIWENEGANAGSDSD